MNEKQNILFIIHAISTGGAERIMSYLTKGFPEEKYNKYLIVYNRKEVEYEFDANCISLDIEGTNNILSKIYNYILRIIKVRKLKKELKIDKSISLLDSPNIINILSKRNDKVIISLRNCKSKEIPRSLGPLYKIVTKFLYNKADSIIAISKGVAKDLIENFGVDEGRIKIIYNPVDKEKIYNLKNQLIEDKYRDIFSENTVINAGRLTNQKGQKFLIKSFRIVVDSIPNAKLVILGTGELKDELEELIKYLNLSENVFLLGFKENLFKYISNSQLFILSSLYEGFGNVILESMVCGTTVISTDCKYGPREILSPNTDIDGKLDRCEYSKYGILVPCFYEGSFNIDIYSNEEKILAKSIIECLNNKELIIKYRNKLEERVNDFDFETILNQWINV